MISKKSLSFQLYLFCSSETDTYPLPETLMADKKIMIPHIPLTVEEIATNTIDPGEQR